MRSVIALGDHKGRLYRGYFTMITQAIKRWLSKLFGWLSWRNLPETEYAPVGSPLNKGVAQESASWTTTDGFVPQSGVAPFIAGQGETSCSTIDEWPKQNVEPPPRGNEGSEQPSTFSGSAKLPQAPKTPPVEPAKTAIDSPGETLSSNVLPGESPAPTPEQKLEFLHYLVKHGIVNEGFSEGKVPEQYRRM